MNTGKPPHPGTQTGKPRTFPHPLKLSGTRVYISNKKYAPPCLVFQQQEPGGPCPWCLWFELSGRSVLGFHLKGPLLGGGEGEAAGGCTDGQAHQWKGAATSDGLTGKQLQRQILLSRTTVGQRVGHRRLKPCSPTPNIRAAFLGKREGGGKGIYAQKRLHLEAGVL